MKNKQNTIQIINKKKESREIVSRILEFGVTEEQKIDIMSGIAMSIESNETMKEIVNFLKKYTTNFNLEENKPKIRNNDKNKILLNYGDENE
tara:strand:- start:3421 stop:3696 length:276 start_codon:yes stop_codon:yes gene_type:complete